MGLTDTVVGGFLGRLIFRQAKVTSTESLSPHFIRLILTGDALRDATWSPGDKLQVYLSNVGTRAYTPVRWDRSIGQTELLLYAHGDTPGVRWARSAKVGTHAQLFGPRASLAVADAGRSFVFGDETSIALALTQASTGSAVLEVTDAAEMQSVLKTLGLEKSVKLIQRKPNDAHRDELISAVAEARASQPDARFFFSGRAAAIQAVRQGLKQRGIALGSAKSKAYWAPGKVGMD